MPFVKVCSKELTMTQISYENIHVLDLLLTTTPQT